MKLRGTYDVDEVHIALFGLAYYTLFVHGPTRRARKVISTTRRAYTSAEKPNLAVRGTTADDST